MKLVKIRLRRVGRWKKPIYSVVVVYANSPVKSGKSFEKLGFYSPSSRPKFFFLNFARTAFWLVRGATVTKTVGILLSKLALSTK